jgi:hypothetical protein
MADCRIEDCASIRGTPPALQARGPLPGSAGRVTLAGALPRRCEGIPRFAETSSGSGINLILLNGQDKRLRGDESRTAGEDIVCPHSQSPPNRPFRAHARQPAAGCRIAAAAAAASRTILQRRKQQRDSATAMIAITTSSSISVNPGERRAFSIVFTVYLVCECAKRTSPAQGPRRLTHVSRRGTDVRRRQRASVSV